MTEGNQMEEKNKNMARLLRATKWVAPIAILVAVIAALWQMSAYYLGTGLAREGYFSWPFLVTVVLPVLVFIGIGFAAFAAYDSSQYSKHLYTEAGKNARKAREKRQRLISVLLLVSMILPLGWFTQGVRWINRYGYETTAVYTANLEVVANAPTPTYDTRLSVPQARLQLRQALSGTGGKLGDVAYIGNKETPEYCAPVLRNATLGRVWTREILCLDPATGTTRSAKFTGNVGSVEGAWSSKLADQVASVRRGMVFTPGDEYGYITDEGQARLVVPVQVGTGEWNRRYDVAGGVVVFEADGTRVYKTQVNVGEIPGPVLPMAIAESVRRSVNTSEGFVKHRNPRRSEASLEGTNMAEGTGATDPNAENPSEFVLVRNGRLYYVTPLTPYGQSQTVVAYLEVAADEVRSGEMPEAKLYRLAEPQASLQLIVQRVTSLYDADIEWMEANEATDASNKARIYEITPADAGRVTLTIGTGTQSLYRVWVESALDGQNKFGTICIHRFRDNVQIRCDSSDSDPAPVGALRGIAGDRPGNGNENEGSGSVDLSGVPTRELLDEIARRIG
jgi:hypothetical protein